MSKNPIVPFATIAVLGIIAIIVMSGVGLNQMQSADDAENGEQTEEQSSSDPETHYENNCMSCHGEDLGGGTGPELQNVSERYSVEELQDIIANGVEGSSMMTGDYANDEEAQMMAEWLSEQ
ncbi:cytochrome c550 [Alkalibacillus salilacus]|uniref:Cytochrome c550 n=1 Tax=Alkalibacillus salilacus TaxID=284582 RepID=A0ABT9VCF2_9BACI|nr:cytochrome c [Alkalibacillus salilacus]MDQ0158650.1 cytochrome c550 [Alkalibacillus salilacus]